MSTWVFITFFAALMQTARTSLQKSLIKHLPTEIITWIRFIFGLPFVILYIVILQSIGLQFPSPSKIFIVYCLFAGLFQIIGTILLVSLFSHRNFAVSTAYSKTEAIQVAIIGSILFQEYLSIASSIAIILGMFGVVLISSSQQSIQLSTLLNGLKHKPVLIGIASGTSFAFDALLIREAILLLNNDNPLTNAAITLLVILILNIIQLGTWILYKNKKMFHGISIYWKRSILVGITSAIGSIAWFTAFALTQAAYVKTVGQIELLFSIFVTQKIFKEGISRIEIISILFIVSSIVLLIYSTN
jgi:drug/metabolite transporter (DMT)-like permease